MVKVTDRFWQNEIVIIEQKKHSSFSQKHNIGIISNFVFSNIYTLFTSYDVSKCEIRYQ